MSVERIHIEGGAAAALAFAMATAMAPRGVDVSASLTLTDEEQERVAALLADVGLTWRPPAVTSSPGDIWRFERAPLDAQLRERLRDDLAERFERMEEE